MKTINTLLMTAVLLSLLVGCKSKLASLKDDLSGISNAAEEKVAFDRVMNTRGVGFIALDKNGRKLDFTKNNWWANAQTIRFSVTGEEGYVDHQIISTGNIEVLMHE